MAKLSDAKRDLLKKVVKAVESNSSVVYKKGDEIELIDVQEDEKNIVDSMMTITINGREKDLKIRNGLPFFVEPDGSFGTHCVTAVEFVEKLAEGNAVTIGEVTPQIALGKKLVVDADEEAIEKMDKDTQIVFNGNIYKKRVDGSCRVESLK